jgi:hypothetical protein
MASRSAFVSAFSRAALLGRASKRSPPCWSARSGGSGRGGRQGSRRVEVLVKQPVDKGKPTQTPAPPPQRPIPISVMSSLGRQFDSNSHAVHRQRVSRPVVKERDVAVSQCMPRADSRRRIVSQVSAVASIASLRPTDQTIDRRSGPHLATLSRRCSKTRVGLPCGSPTTAARHLRAGVGGRTRPREQGTALQ